jgi:ATP-binding cassette, subfamily C (CFTR/MRP), member 1
VALALVAKTLTVVCIWVVFLQIMPQSAIRLHWKVLDVVMRAPLSFLVAKEVRYREGEGTELILEI